MTAKERYEGCLKWWEENDPLPQTELHYQSLWQLLVAVILSAQCTDKRVNMITPPLFEAYPTPASMARALPEDIYEYIKSVTYPNSKSRNLVAAAKMIDEQYDGKIPNNLDDLLKIPGVGRKTANVMLAVAFEQAAMPVDTHVFRVANRIGLTRASRTVLNTEKTLMKKLPKDLVAKTHHWLILHGRYTCKARKPDCAACGLKEFCKAYQKESKNYTLSPATLTIPKAKPKAPKPPKRGLPGIPETPEIPEIPEIPETPEIPGIPENPGNSEPPVINPNPPASADGGNVPISD